MRKRNRATTSFRRLALLPITLTLDQRSWALRPLALLLSSLMRRRSTSSSGAAPLKRVLVAKQHSNSAILAHTVCTYSGLDSSIMRLLVRARLDHVVHSQA